MGLTGEITFNFSIGGYPGLYFNVQLANNLLVCRQGREGEEDKEFFMKVTELVEWKMLLDFLKPANGKLHTLMKKYWMVLTGSWQLRLHPFA